jgi:lysophospholipase L1-like esterase
MNRISLLLLLVTANLAAQEKLPFNPQDGESIVFLGDSITHECLYTQYLENFFITRYPDRKLTFHNSGVSGDIVANGLVRFDDDVAKFKPNYVTVLFGMNDGHYEDYNADAFATYQKNMATTLDRIKEIGARPIVLSPTMFDHSVVSRRKDDPTWRFRTRSFSPNYNALMAFYGGWCLEESGRRGIPFVSLWAPLNTHTIEQRRTNPEFSLVADAIHPQAAGQMVMAFEILSQLGVETSSTNSIVISKRGKNWNGTKGVQNLQVNETASELTFTHTAKSLPWVIPIEESALELKWALPSDGRIGYAITKAGHKLSADRLKIVGLAPGNYEVLIDGQSIGKWNHATLGTKIELQENDKTPQYQQALKVALLNQKRNDELERPLRDIWGQIKGLQGKPDKKPELDAAKSQATELAQKSAELLKQVYAAAKPVPHTWTIRLIQQ